MIGGIMKYLTTIGQKKLLEELAYLTKVKRVELAEQLRFATSLGDLRENSEYDAVCEDFEMTENRIYELEHLLNESTVYLRKNDGTVEIGSVVVLDVDGEFETYGVVGVNEADILNNKISYESPLGQSILGRKENDIVHVDTEISSYSVRIIGID